MANIIKNIDPPIELTQAEYNALSTEQKNNGTIYYVSDGTGVMKPASALITNNSNAQADFNNLNNNISNLISGETESYSALYLDAPSVTGIKTDQHGNFVHKNSSSGAHWNLVDMNGVKAFSVYFQTGQINFKDKIFCYGVGNTLNSVWRGVGQISNSGKTLTISIPLLVSSLVTNINVNRIYGLYVHNNVGGYAYMKHGATFTQLSYAEIWKDSKQVQSNSIQSITTTLRTNVPSLIFSIVFTNRLVTTSTGSTNVANNMPLGVQMTLDITFS